MTVATITPAGRADQLYPFTDPVAADTERPRRIVSGDGCRVTDSEGNRFIDAVSGLWCASLGFDTPRLADAAARQMRELAYYHSFMGRTSSVIESYAARLVEKLPGDLAHVFFATSGSEAVETAAKFVRYYQNARGRPDKKKIIARRNAYHGSGQVSAALTGLGYCHDGFDLPLDMVPRAARAFFFGDAEPGETETAYARRLGRELDALIRHEGPDMIGAFIGEPVMGSGGVYPPPEGYWAEVQEVLAKHDVLLIADEIITGFGRTGEWFACETYGIRPDLMTMAKQMTAAAFPMSAVALTGGVRDTIAGMAHELGTFGHGMTYGGHPVGAAVALETLAIYEEMDLPAHVRRMGEHVARRLATIGALDGVADVRGVGLMAAVEMRAAGPTEPSLARRVGEEAERRGVLFRIIGDVLAISPPYTCSPEEIDTIMDVMEQSIRWATGTVGEWAVAAG